MSGPEKPALRTREIQFRHSAKFVPILEHLGCSLLLSTYAAGKVVSVGATAGELKLEFSNFQQAMGIAVHAPGTDQPYETIAVGGPNLIWFLRDGGAVAAQVEPPGTYDRAFLTRESFVTGNIHVHEMQWGEGGELWLVNTLFSCLATLHEDFSFLPRWRPSFISELAPEDRCHLNGMAMVHGRPKFLTALGASDEPRGWRENKASGGIVLDYESGEIVARGLCMPHSPRWHQGRLWVLDSGKGRLVTIDPNSGEIDQVENYPGYGRGLAFCGQFAFVGMSRARETSVFGGVPICQSPDEMRCGLVVVDLNTGKSVAFLEFETGVEELFDVQVIAGCSRAMLSGPYPREDRSKPVWVVPGESQQVSLSKIKPAGAVARNRKD